MPEIISRKQAVALGLGHYFTGKPCKHGHLEIRRVGSARCEACVREYAARYRRENRGLFNKANRAYRARNVEKVRKYARDYVRKWREARKDQINARARELYAKNPEHYRAKCRSYSPKRKRKDRMKEYYIGPSNPKGEKSWLRKNRIMLRNLKRLLSKPNLDHSLWLSEGQRR